ncbi:hypothetical protein F4604DRAFT_1919570 [Suillus subluteus]|nr:hypothetical protein F4604DRAFT_1919570 [Suillus subluteus]
MSLTLPEYLNDIVILLMSWQVGMLDDEGLFTKFFDHEVNMPGESHLLASYRIVPVCQYSWWKDRFDVIPFQMPDCITPGKVIKLYREHAKQLPFGHLLCMQDHTHEPGLGPDPLLTNLRVIRDDLQQFGAKLEEWLSEKIGDGNHALDQMAGLYVPAEDLYDTMVASEELLGAEE